MSKKHKHHHKPPTTSTADLKARIERTRREGRFQQALELVKQLHKVEPSPASLDLLKDTYFQRAVQLRTSGHTRDAVTVLEVAAALDGKNGPWLEKLASEIALCGDVTRSRQMLERLPGGLSGSRAAVLLADAAFMQDKGGRNALPESMQKEYDLIVQAFKELETGQDEQAKTTLQGIGLRSAFMEWKMFARGLQAFYQQDDDRARENWQRLDPQRLPARLAAPMRCAIDPAYRTLQPAATQQALQQQLGWLQGVSTQSQLRSLRPALENQESLAGAFRIAEGLLPIMHQQAPHLIPRLAQCFYWAIPRTGPDELPRYKRVFGAPQGDPHFHRLEALAYEQGDDQAAAHRYWQLYEREIGEHREAWPGDQAKLARALIWLHMGENAAAIPSQEQRKKLPRFLRELEGLPPPLNPGAEACFTKALDLVPNLLEAHAGLFHFHLRNEHSAKAIKAGRRLLELFPDHLQTLEDLAELYGQQEKHKEELELLQQALKHNPLDRNLRRRLSDAHLRAGREAAVKSQFDQARPHYENAINFAEPGNHSVLACCWATCELKAGNQPRADELLTQARTKSAGEMLVTWVLLVETIRLKLPHATKTRFTKEFNEAVGDTPTPGLAMALLEYMHHLLVEGVEYHGQKTHTKKIFAYIDRVDKDACTEEMCVALLERLVRVETPVRMMQRFFAYATDKYPDNPFVPYLQAIHLMGDDPEAGPPMNAMWMLQQAEQLARPRASEPAVKTMLEDIGQRLKLFRAFRSLLPGFGAFGGFPGGFPAGLEELLGGIDPSDLFGFGGDDDEDEYD